MKILILILARGGSKRLPKKNIKKLGKLPLIQWTINFAKKFESYPVLLSTDDKSIFNIGIKNNILTPWLRPKVFSGDKASSTDAALHAINWYEKKFSKLDGLILLQPTSPFRNLNQINKGIRNFKRNRNSIIAVYHNKNTNTGFIIKNRFRKILERVNNNLDVKKKIYSPTGSFYIISTHELKKNNSFFNSKTEPLIISDRKYQTDIDTIKDFNEAKKWI